MSSKVPPNASVSQNMAGPTNTYRPRAGASSASEAAAIHARTRNAPSHTATAYAAQSNVSSTPLNVAATSTQSSNAPREKTAYSSRVGTSSASQAAALHASRTRGHIADANHPPISSETPNGGTTQSGANTPKNIASPAATYHPTAGTSSASQAAGASSRPVYPPILSVSSEPLSPLVMQLANGPSEDICRRILTIYAKEWLGYSNSEDDSVHIGNR